MNTETSPMTTREFDLVIYGATGFTGRLVAEYLAASSGGLNWAMAGRSMSRLEAVRDEIGAPDDHPLITADSNDPDSLAAMAQRAKAVISTVGPYQLYGDNLVAACAAAGTDYADLCGEPAWMRDVIGRHHETAAGSGARIVLSCGFDSIPFDLGVWFLQTEAVRRTGKPIRRVKGRVRKMKGGFSGGTAASFAETMARAAREPHIIGWLKDPFSLTPGFSGPEQPSGAEPVFEPELDSWAAPFIMAAINTKNIHRSNALLGHMYGEDFVYDEMILTGPGEAGQALAAAVAKDRSMAENPPRPGEGPSKEERESGHYEIMFTGVMENGERLTAVAGGHLDPGYGSTSRMIAEAGAALALDVTRDETPGGVWTPAPALGEALLDRLTSRAGLYFTIEE